MLISSSSTVTMTARQMLSGASVGKVGRESMVAITAMQQRCRTHVQAVVINMRRRARWLVFSDGEGRK